MALRGQAQGRLGYLPIDKQKDYAFLVKALEERFPHLIKLSCTGFNSLSDDKSQQKAYLNLVRQLED